MIEYIIHILIVVVVVSQSAEGLLRQSEIVELILENDPAVVQTVLKDLVAGAYLLLCERYLGEVIFPLVRVVLCTVHTLVERVLQGLGLCYGVALLAGELLVLLAVDVADIADDGLVCPLPVVGVLAFTPQPLECRLSLIHRHGVIEVPRSVLLCRGVCLIIFLCSVCSYTVVTCLSLSRFLFDLS